MPRNDAIKLPTINLDATMRRTVDYSRYVDFTTTGSAAVEKLHGRIATLTTFNEVADDAEGTDPQDGFCIVMHELRHSSLLHYHDYLEVTHVFTGNVLMYVEGDTTTVETGGTMVVKTGARHLISPLITENPPTEIDLIISTALLNTYMSAIPASGDTASADTALRDWLTHSDAAPPSLYIPPGRLPALSSAIDRLIYAYCSAPVYHLDFATSGALLECLAHIGSALQTAPQQDPLVSDVMDAITDDLRGVTSESIARRVGYSVGYLSRYVKSHCGKTMGQLINETRMNRAAALLRETDMTIEDIAHAVGYESPSYLYKRFREQFLVTPKEYRRLFHETDLYA